MMRSQDSVVGMVTKLRGVRSEFRIPTGTVHWKSEFVITSSTAFDTRYEEINWKSAKRVSISNRQPQVKYSKGMSLYWPRRHITKVEVYLHSFWTSVPDGDEWSAWCLGRFTPGETAPIPIE